MPDYADEYAAAVRYAADRRVQHYVTLRLKDGRTVRRLVSTNRDAAALRDHYRQQGHFPLTVEVATDAHRAMFERQRAKATGTEPAKTVDWTPGTAPTPKDIRHNPDLDAAFADEHQPFEVTVEGANGQATVALHAADEAEAKAAGKALGGKVISVRRRHGPPPSAR